MVRELVPVLKCDIAGEADATQYVIIGPEGPRRIDLCHKHERIPLGEAYAKATPTNRPLSRRQSGRQPTHEVVVINPDA